MCSNWTRGNRKEDMTLAQIEQAFSSNLWKDIENASISGGEPTTRNDLVEIARVMIDKFPKLRKLTLNTTGITHHRAIPMLTKIVELCNERKVIFSTRVSIDGVNEMHGSVRNVRNAFEKAGKTIKAMQELQKTHRFNFGISSTIFSKNLEDADNILAWAKKEKLDIVFNMVRFTDAMLGNAELEKGMKPIGAEEQKMRKFFLDRVRQDPLLDGQNYIYMHYADMIANGYHRTAPCPFMTQGIMLNPNGDLFFCENSDVIGNATKEDPEAVYFREAAQQHRKHIRDEKCPTCLSPCQMNVAAIKQVMPYARFLVRASMEKRRSGIDTVAAPPGLVRPVNARSAPILLAAAAYLATYLAVANPLVLAFGLASQVLFVLPGILILRAIAPAQGWLPALGFGPFVGQALGSLVLTLLWITGAHGAWLLIAAPLIVSLLAVPARRLAGRWTLPSLHADDAIALSVLLLIVPVVVGLPFAHVGEITANGQDYRAYFTADYAWRRAVVSEVAKGDVLPVNPYFAGDALHYYWMPHVLSAVQYRFAAAWATLDELLLIRSISIDAMFVAFLYAMTRAFRVRPWAAAAGVTFVVFASSFEGLYALWDFARQGAPLRAVTNLNIDAISRWYFQGIPIDGLQRVLFYQPHHAVGYVIGMIGLLAIALRTRGRDATAFAIAGVCLGLSIAISSFAGLMVTAGAALFEAVSLLRAFSLRRAIVHAVAAGVPLGLATALVFALRYVDNSGSVVEFTVNRVAVHDFWWVTFLSFGPVLIVGASRSSPPGANRTTSASSARSRSRRSSSTSSSTSAITRTSTSAGASAISCSCRRPSSIGALFNSLHDAARQRASRGRRRLRHRVPCRPADQRHRHLQHAGHHESQRDACRALDAAPAPG